MIKFIQDLFCLRDIRYRIALGVAALTVGATSFLPRKAYAFSSLPFSQRSKRGLITNGKINVREVPRCRLNIYFNFKIFTKVKFGSSAPCRGDVSHLLYRGVEAESKS